MRFKFFFKKIISMLLTLFGVSFLVFAAFEIIPGDPAISRLGTDATPEMVAALREQMGLNRPFIVRYFDWLFDCIRGDFGRSYSYNRTVISMIGDKLPITVTPAPRKRASFAASRLSSGSIRLSTPEIFSSRQISKIRSM